MDSTRLSGDALETFRILEASRPQAFAPIPPCSGTDSKASIELTIDAAKQVVGIKVDDNRISRDPSRFILAIQEAFAAADMRRLVAAYTATDAFDGAFQGHDDRFRVDTELNIPRPTDVDVSQEASLERAAMRRTEERRPLTPRPGTSRNGYLTIQRDIRGDIREIEVDEMWLSSARPESLENSVLEAAAYTLEFA